MTVSESSFTAPSSFTPVVFATPPQPTPVWQTLWEFTAERQAIFWRRLQGWPQPWTEDHILQSYRFTNVYRVLDRTTQYLIKHVIAPDTGLANLVFRILLFKLFNRVSTWEYLERRFGELALETFVAAAFDEALCELQARGRPIYTGAYIMPPPPGFFYPGKHRRHLALLETMLQDGIGDRIASAPTMAKVCQLLQTYPGIGRFLSYQLCIDLNYSWATSFSEMEFVVPGPGAESGLAKVFAHPGSYSQADLVRYIADGQGDEFARRGLEFRYLRGRPLQLVDCQNILCEVDKYARVAHPEIEGRGGRKKLKRRFEPSGADVSACLPAGWDVA